MRLGLIGFSSWELIFAIFRKNQALRIFWFLFSTCNRNTYFQTINQYFVVYRFVSEWKRQVVIEQTRFLSTVFLCSEFKLENIYSGVNFCGKNVCGNLFLRISGKIAKNRTRKNFVPHGSLIKMSGRQKLWCKENCKFWYF